MMETSMKYNGSGYYDETPYRATMQMAKPGEIWSTDMGKEYLILKNHGTLCSVIFLTENPPRFTEDSIEVMSVGPRWAKISMVQYMFNQNFSERVATLPEDEYLSIMELVGETLGVTITVHKEETDASVDLAKAQQQVESLTQKILSLQASHACEMERLEKALAESKEACGVYEKRIIEMEGRPQADPAAAVYKQLYHELLDKIIAGGGLK